MYVFLLGLHLYCMATSRTMAGNVQGVAVNNTLTLGYLVPWTQGTSFGPTMGSAIIVGLQEVERRRLLPGYTIEWMLQDDWCEPLRGMYVTVDIWKKVADLDGFIGSICSVVCEAESLLAASWGIPVVATACSSNILSDREIHPTFTRLDGSFASRAPFFDRIADVYGWKIMGIISTQEDLFKGQAIATMQYMQKMGKNVILQTVDTTVLGDQVDPESMNALSVAMENMKSKVRILYLMSYSADLRNMLLTALDLDMMNGEFVFLTNEPVLGIVNEPQTYRPEDDDIIYQGILAVGILHPSGPDWDQFTQKVIDSFEHPQFANLPHVTSPKDTTIYAGISIFVYIYTQNK